MNEIGIFDSALVIRNFLDGLNLVENGPNIIKVHLINVKHVKRRNEKEEFIFLNNIKSDKNLYGYPALDETLRADIFKFFNVNMTNYVNRILKSTYANIKIVNNKPVEGVMTIESYIEDMPELIKLADKNPALEKALRKIEFIEKLDISDEAIKEDLKAMFYIGENVLPLIFVNTMYAVKVDKTSIPHNTAYEKGLPVVIDPNKIFPQTGISSSVLDDETLVFTDGGLNLINRNYNENLSLRKFNADEIFAYKVYDS